MAVEFKYSAVTEKRNRWLINLILLLAVVALVGFSMIPLIGEIIQSSQAPTATSPSPTQTGSPVPKKEELEAQVKGYELVLQREPDNQTALRGLLEAKLGLGDVKGAIPPLEKLAKLNPDQGDYAVLLAQAKQQVGDREGAAQAYRDILKTKPGDVNALRGFTNLLMQQNRPEAAIGLLQDTLKAAPKANQAQAGSVDTVSVKVLLGDVYASQKRFDEAIAVFEDATKDNAQDFRPILGKALVLQRQGKTEDAKPLFTKASEMAPAQFKDQINRLAAGPTLPSPTAPGPSPIPASPGATAPTTTPASPAPVPANP